MTREITDLDLDFSTEAMTPDAAPGHMRRAGGFRVVRPTAKGPVAVAKVGKRETAEALCHGNDWVEEVAA